MKALPLEVREQAKALYLAGMSPTTIAEKLKASGVTRRCVGKWAERYEWVNLRDGLKAEIDAGVAKIVGLSLKEQGQQVRKALGNELAEQTAMLRNTPIRNARELAGRNGRSATVKTISDCASSVFQWDQQESKPIVDIHLLARLTIAKPADTTMPALPEPSAEAKDGV